jgi:hypothetical protein
MKGTFGRALVVGTLLITAGVGTATAQEQEGLHNLQEAVLFIYNFDGLSDPCAEQAPGQTLLPAGTGFLVGIPKKGASLDKERWEALNILITAKHVVTGKDRIVVRLNRADNTRFTCRTIPLKWDGREQNSFLSQKPEVDIAGIVFRQVPDTDPNVIPYQYVLDQKSMNARQVEEGTDVFTIGYLFGYSGQKKNYTVKKFGKIALLTEENWWTTESNPSLPEKAYLVDLQNVPGLSGAPMILQSPRLLIMNNSLSFRRGGPYVIGVVKGLATVHVSGGVISEGVTAIEPGSELKALLQQIASLKSSASLPLELPETPAPK